MSEIREYIAEDTDDGKRIDRFLSEVTEDEISRSRIQRLISDNAITIGDSYVKSSQKLHTGDVVRLVLPDPVSIDIVPEDIALDIIYEDEDILIVNKPKGMVVHPAPGHMSGTLVNAIMFHCKDSLSGINGQMRPGIVHRIDRDTTGSLIICKNDASHRSIAAQLAEHSINRIYRGIVIGRVGQDEGIVNAPIGRDKKDRKKMAIDQTGRHAITHYRVIERFKDHTYMEFKLETGRTHQIRVHMAHIGHPILGDDVYGPSKCKFNLEGQTLHAMTIGFIHPRTGQYVEFEAPLPDYFERILKIISQ